MNGFDYTELDELNRDILKLANETMPKESKKFLRKEGTKMTRTMKRKLKTGYKKKTGNLVKMVRKGKAHYSPANGAYRIEIKFAPHMNVVDYGHRNWKNGKMVRGKEIKDREEEKFSEEFEEDVLDFIDDLLDKGLS